MCLAVDRIICRFGCSEGTPGTVVISVCSWFFLGLGFRDLW